MNTAFLSAIPAAPPQEQPVPARPAKSGKPVIKTDESAESAPVNESEPQSAGDTDKADAFAEMLAAMISVATPAVETHVETVQPAAVESVTSTATDIPRDGAGSPLFAASFMTSSPVATEVAAATTSNSTVKSGIAAGEVGSEADQLGAAATTRPGSQISEAAVAELAGLDTGAVEASPEAGNLTVEAEGSGDVVVESMTPPTADFQEGTAETERSAIEAHETNAGSGDVGHDAADGQEPAGRFDQPVKMESGRTPSHSADAKPAPVVTDVTAPQAETSVDRSVAEASHSTVREASNAESAQVTTPEPAPQNADQVDEPYEDPVEPQAGLEESTSARSEGSRKSSSTGSRPVTNSAPSPVEPEVANAVTAVENSAPVINGKDVVREHAADPAAPADKPVAVNFDSEAFVSTGAGETAAAQSAAGITPTHTDSTAAATPSHISQQVLQALAAYEAQLPQGGTRSFEMLLDPPELGRLLVQMSRTSKGVDVRISAENETVRSILENTGGELQQSLQLAGFDLGQFSGSSSGETFANGDEWVAAPSLQSFASSGSVQSRSNTTQNSGTSAVNVMV